MQGSFFARRFLAWIWATTFVRALWGSSFLHFAALTGLLAWAGAARQIPGGGGRGGMQLDLTAGDGSPSGPLKCDLVGDPYATPQIAPWTKTIAQPQAPVAAAPELTDIPSPPGDKDKPRSDDEQISDSHADRQTAASSPIEVAPDSHDTPSEPLLGPRAPHAPEKQPDKKTDSQVQMASAQSAAAGHEPSGTSGGFPSYFGNIPPRYPEIARRNGWEGTVLLHLHVDVKGRVTQVELISSSGYPVLDNEAIAALQHWVGLPATRNGMPVETDFTKPVHFALH